MIFIYSYRTTEQVVVEALPTITTAIIQHTKPGVNGQYLLLHWKGTALSCLKKLHHTALDDTVTQTHFQMFDFFPACATGGLWTALFLLPGFLT